MNKIRELKEIVQEIKDGSEVALGGFVTARCPMAFAAELVRQGKKDLRCYALMGSLEDDFLLGAGCMKEYSYGGASLDRFGRLERVNASIEAGGNPTVVKEYSALSQALRFLGATMGMPFVPTKSLMGTDIAKQLLDAGDDSIKMGTDPWTGEDYLYLKVIRPEYSVIHANAVDAQGDVLIYGPKWDLDLAKAGKKLLVTAERLVSDAYVKAHPEEVSISGAYTYAAAIVPAGSFPASTFGEYDYDAKAMRYYCKVNRSQEAFDALIDEYVLGTADHYAFLEKIGGLPRLSRLRSDRIQGYRTQDLEKPR